MASGEEEQRPAPLKSPECRGSESRGPARESLLLPASHYLGKGAREPGGGNQNTPARAHTGCPSEVVFSFPFPPTSSIPLQETFLSKQHGCLDTSTLRQLLKPEHGVDKISPLGIDTLWFLVDSRKERSGVREAQPCTFSIGKEKGLGSAVSLSYPPFISNAGKVLFSTLENDSPFLSLDRGQVANSG